jgi:hypothetical protein
LRSLLGGLLIPAIRFSPPTAAQLTRSAAGIITLTGGQRLDVELTRLTTRPDYPPSGVESLVWRTQAAKRADSDPDSSQIGITRVTAADGSVGWLVSLHGTQVDPPLEWDSNPSGMLTNFRALIGDINEMGLATTAALVDAGVQRGEPVVLSGHSQGGIVSAALAADPDFTARFAVAAVLTIGSPVSRLRPARSTQVLSLEHTQDIMPALSGGGNPRTANQTTVLRDLSEASDPAVRAAAGGLGPAHKAAAYADTAKLVDSSTDPSIAAWREAARPILGAGPGATAETTYYTVRRQ